ILVAADGERQTEGEDQPDDAEQRALEDAEGLTQRGLVLAQVSPGGKTGRRGAADDGDEQQRDAPCRQREEHRAILGQRVTRRLIRIGWFELALKAWIRPQSGSVVPTYLRLGEQIRVDGYLVDRALEERVKVTSADA